MTGDTAQVSRWWAHLLWVLAAGGVGVMVSALGASVLHVFVTAAYHWGYMEFRGPALVAPLLGNALITIGYLLTTNLMTPVIAHMAIHIAAVLHGMETTVQLPPHY
jgi:hypothetical protein